MTIKKDSMIYKYIMILIATCTTVVYFIPYACYDFYNHFLETYNITDGQAGELLSFFGITAVIGYFIGGWIADRFNPKSLVVMSAVLTAAAGTVVAFSSSFTVLKIMYFIFGITSTCMHWSAFLKLIKNIGSDEEQGRLFGFYNFAFGLIGVACTYLILGMMETALAKYEFRGGMMIYCVISIIFGILTWIFVPYDEEKAKSRESADDKIDLKLVGKVLKMPITWYLGLFTLGYFLIRSTIPYLNPYMTDAFGISVGVAALLTNTLRSGMNLVSGPIGGFFIDKLKSSTKVVMAGSLGTLVFTVVLMMVPQQHNMITLLMVTCVILLLFSYVNSTALYTPVTEAKVPFRYVGTVLGVASAIGYSSDIWLYNVCGSWLDAFGNAGYKYIWMLQGGGAVMMMITGLLMAGLYRKAQNSDEKD
ncbi:MAG: hypothetical protein DBY08_05745 [Clostridiales bacterium]|nr:MFS transporter [Bacillota bacterium]MEE0517056.1 MFS transporter [Anaerovoracaceae bacterium]PWL93208.1 MAG: hypothetical protein DBY08_05745 [Clostridiales bacterium]